MHIFDLNGNLLKSFKREMLNRPYGVYALNDQEIYIGNDDRNQRQIFVFDNKFSLKRTFGDFNLNCPINLVIDKEYNPNILYVSDLDNEITIWDAKRGIFIDKIVIDSPDEMTLTKVSLFVISGIRSDNAEIINNKVEVIKKGGNCIFEYDKNSLEIKRRITGDWYSPCGPLSILSNGNIQIIAYTFDKNRIKSEFRYFFTLDKNGRILNKVLLDGFKGIHDVAVINNKVIITLNNTMTVFEFND